MFHPANNKKEEEEGGGGRKRGERRRKRGEKREGRVKGEPPQVITTANGKVGKVVGIQVCFELVLC